ncbi:alkyl/aryl-sulfatase [Hyphomonas sp.]|uniref:alkyl/aryl-sulfatase n=1 Tax=Hyphomonas sp. TaxID=87 RepID=UPI003528AECD
MRKPWLVSLGISLVVSCGPAGTPDQTVEGEPTPPPVQNWEEEAPPSGRATPATVAYNGAVSDHLPLDDEGDFQDSQRGLLAQLDHDVLSEDGEIVWRVNAYDFLNGAVPETVNPSLWRQSRLNAQHGLFQVTDGIYQVRGYDVSVMSIIRGETGWIIVDPLFTTETAAAALALVNDTLGERPVSAVIYTHSHVDHFGGVRGVIGDGDGIPIYAPEGFSEAAISENLLAGNYTARRTAIMFGNNLERSPTGQVGTGIGQAIPRGTVSLILPTEEIAAPGASRVIDGVTFEFMDAQVTEAPAEFVFFLPEFSALCSAEVTTATFHNVLSLRGSKARDTLHWSKVIDDMLVRYANRADVVFASHNWPTWGRDEVREYLRGERDIYRYTHDQAMRQISSGVTLQELPEIVPEPATAGDAFHERGYYGTLNHNLKAVYQFYFGWWDGVPANLNLLPPVDRAKRMVDAMGGVEASRNIGIEAFRKGDYRWAADVLNQVIFADPDDTIARQWLASSYEQMGFQAESGSWRNYYLSAAHELRQPEDKARLDDDNSELVSAVPSLALFDALAARYRPDSIEGAPYVLVFKFTDTAETITIEVGESSIFPRLGEFSDLPAATFETTREDFNRIMLGNVSPRRLMLTGKLKIAGNRGAVQKFFKALVSPESGFEIFVP